jgi:site-specific recombinase XerD
MSAEPTLPDDLNNDADKPATSIEVVTNLADLATFELALESWVAGHLSAHTRRAYLQDSRHFLTWLAGNQLELKSLSQANIAQYQRYLVETFAKPTASRKFTIARKLLDEAVQRGVIDHNPAYGLKGIKTDQETPHKVLSYKEAKALLLSIDTSTRQGKRDFALVMLLLRTGIRRSECADLRLGDLSQEQGHFLATIRHGKGDKRRQIKLPVDVMRAINEYLEALCREDKDPNAPLFVQFRKGDRPQKEGISDQVIERVVESYAAKLDLELSPHGLRATFVTLALEAGAKLHQVQYAVGHADPRTTERYQKRKFNLDDNATDYLRFDLGINR